MHERGAAPTGRCGRTPTGGRPHTRDQRMRIGATLGSPDPETALEVGGASLRLMWCVGSTAVRRAARARRVRARRSRPIGPRPARHCSAAPRGRLVVWSGPNKVSARRSWRPSLIWANTVASPRARVSSGFQWTAVKISYQPSVRNRMPSSVLVTCQIRPGSDSASPRSMCWSELTAGEWWRTWFR